MLRKTIALICLGVLIGGGCAKKAAPVTTTRSVNVELTASDSISRMAASPMVMGGGGGSVSAASRYLAVRQKLVVVAPGAALAKSLEAVVAFCGTDRKSVV